MSNNKNVEKLIDKLYIQVPDGNYIDGIAICHKILSIDPNNLKAYFNLAYCYGKLKRYKKALYYYDKTLKLDKNYLVALTNKVIILNEIGELNDITKTYEEILKLSLLNNVKNVTINALYNLNKLIECLLVCDGVLTEDPYEADALFYKALALKDIANYSESLKTANKLLEINPHNLFALGLIAETYVDIKEYEKAAKTFKFMLEINPDDPNAIIGLSRIEDIISNIN